MEPEPDVTFLFQFGNIRDTQRVPLASLNLKTLKDLAVDFINEKVSIFALLFLLFRAKRMQT